LRQKKTISYILAGNIPELLPFLFFIVLQIPLPLSTILILGIDVGTDLYPAFSIAYEPPAKDIMFRKPRWPHKDKLVTFVLIRNAYLLRGVIEVLSSNMLTVIFNGWNGVGLCGSRLLLRGNVRQRFSPKSTDWNSHALGRQKCHPRHRLVRPGMGLLCFAGWCFIFSFAFYQRKFFYKRMRRAKISSTWHSRHFLCRLV
jgi:magnesium-transporting ATPase (P-type)